MERGVAAVREALSFRRSMAVRTAVLYRSGDTYPLCPRCRIPMDREYQRFCDRCGQRLDWSTYQHALITVRF